MLNPNMLFTQFLFTTDKKCLNIFMQSTEEPAFPSIKETRHLFPNSQILSNEDYYYI